MDQQSDNINAWDLTCLKTTPAHDHSIKNKHSTNYFIKNQTTSNSNEPENGVSKFSEFSTIGGVLDMSSTKISPNKISVIKENSLDPSQNCRLNNKMNNQNVNSKLEGKNKVPKTSSNSSSTDSNKFYSIQRHSFNNFSQVTTSTTPYSTHNQGFSNYIFLNQQHLPSSNNFSNTQYDSNLIMSSPNFISQFSKGSDSSHSSNNNNNKVNLLPSNEIINSNVDILNIKSRNCDHKNNLHSLSKNNINSSTKTHSNSSKHQPVNASLSFVRSDAALDSSDVVRGHNDDSTKYSVYDVEVYSISDDDDDEDGNNEEGNDRCKKDINQDCGSVKNNITAMQYVNKKASPMVESTSGNQSNFKILNIIEDEGIMVHCGDDPNNDDTPNKSCSTTTSDLHARKSTEWDTTCSSKSPILKRACNTDHDGSSNDNNVGRSIVGASVNDMNDDDSGHNLHINEDCDLGVAVNQRVSFHSIGELIKNNECVIELYDEDDDEDAVRRVDRKGDGEINAGVTTTKRITTTLDEEGDGDDDVVEIDMDNNMEVSFMNENESLPNNVHCLETNNNELHSAKPNYETKNYVLINNDDGDDDDDNEDDEFQKLFGKKVRRRRGRKPKTPSNVVETPSDVAETPKNKTENDENEDMKEAVTPGTSEVTVEEQDVKDRLLSSFKGRRTRGRGSRRGGLTRAGFSRQLKRDASKMEDGEAGDGETGDGKEAKNNNDEDHQKVVKKRKLTNFAEQLNNVANAPTKPNIVEYQWPQARNAPWYILQEHISEYLGVLSFKRKYPNISRRPVEYQERQYLIDQGCVTEVQCDLGLTVLNAEEVLKLMSQDYPEKYQEYTRFSRKRLKFVEKPGSASDGVTKLENLMKKAIKSAAEFNASLCKDRRQARSMYIDLQTMELHKPQSRKAVVNYSSVNLCDSYPVALVPGQYQHYYKRYTPTELNYFPLNTALYAPPKMMQSIYVDPNQPEKEASDEDVEQEEAVDDLLTTIPQTPSLDKKSTSSSNRPTRTRTTLSNNKKFQPFSTSSITNEDSNTSFGSEKKIRKGGPGRGKKSVRCGMCNQTTKNKYNEPDDLIKCNTCNVSNHPGCLGLSAEMVPMIKTYDWQCMECKVCYQCTQPHDEDKMMFCDNCDRGYHTYCVGLISIPEGRWDCVTCTTTNNNINNNNINESIINNNTNDSSSNINFTENSNSVASNDNSNIGFSFFQNNSFKFPSSFSPTAQTGVGALSNISRPSSLKSRRGRPMKPGQQAVRDDGHARTTDSPSSSINNFSSQSASSKSTGNLPPSSHMSRRTSNTEIVIENDDDDVLMEADDNDNMSLSLTCENDVTESCDQQAKRNSNRNDQ